MELKESSSSKKKKKIGSLKKVKKNNGVKLKKASLLKRKKKKNNDSHNDNKKDKDKLDELYKLEIKNYKKKGKKRKKHYGGSEEEVDSSDDNSDLLNNDYSDIEEIAYQVKEQVSLYKFLLRMRILTQKVLCLSNKMPLLPFVAYNEKLADKEKKNENEKQVFESAENCTNINDSLSDVQLNEEKLKNDIGELLTLLHNLLKNKFIKVDIPVNKDAYNQVNIICDEEDKPFFENRTKLYEQDTIESEKKLFSLIDTWFKYSKKMCLNFFDIMHKITKISSVKSLKTYEQPISSQISQVMFDLPALIQNSCPQAINYHVVGQELYKCLYPDGSNFNLNQYIYDDEVYYKKFLLNAIQNLKDNQEDSELLKSQRQIYKIKKKYESKHVNKGKIISFDPIPKLVNFMLPEPRDSRIESTYDYMDNPELVEVLLSSLFQS
ncbi:conserved Plasmodium protein, unknown function [Plasmodium knowlesi strain H]|uniref:AATF leucine zipper-containing domain-containing protein n=3 Tax=Plasmodium knowlesi TaxID=5850 RepID=A0A5K1UWX1_PLAKH|nr:conserved Plasmodium protein, unknown function [Plasmodium knowlesi strain H]OTN66855.1 Uncharacterized protein PKNOH_S08474100 [Plasmodium knowlesi]CAA9990066.1 conserved Plasmodium protein, unknown function [Plasmodium knowlesi strain H]SBO25727.1 conserved Plasmodium protein, unknown function [Plasmodium knowlesi strain H]SBO28538.1 conserved Plasmodium protein, unknown function [Plasmodium knowlesi strain H]VVS79540.1 conserved Plasmodium protein, unknown function [Plasmodium knowlesi s|eukprot:XP_002260533.1 hypothetical protein, conserved in Plasmodium species [Plasmodium knowlesi strain H]